MKRVAVVEDNPDNRLLVRAILEDLYELIEYESGREALEKIPVDRPQVVLLDISLPEVDGQEVLRRLRESSDLLDMPIVALTAHAMMGDEEKARACGCSDYLAKPIDEDQLMEKIDRLLDVSAVTPPRPL